MRRLPSANPRAVNLLVFAGSYHYGIGGGPVLAPLLLSALAARGHAVTVLTDQRRDAELCEIAAGVTIKRLPFKRALGGDMNCFAAIQRHVAAAKRQANAVYLFSHGRGDLFHHLTQRAAPRPCMVTLHDLYPPRQFQPDAMVARNLAAAARITACSRAALVWTCRHLPGIAPRGVVVRNAVPVPVLASRPADPKRLLFAGRLVTQKGCDLAIEALARLAPVHPGVSLVIAGEGPEQAALAALAARCGVAERVSFLGQVARDELIELMAGCAMLLVPSRDEPFGLVALEAAHAGRPVVAANVGGLPEVVAQNETGLLVPPESSGALAAAAASLVADPGMAGRLGAQARRRAQADFRFEDYVAAHERLLLDMAA
jgi:glycogen(starch) synthase